MDKRGLGREYIYDATRGQEHYPHPLVSCMLPFVALLTIVVLGLFGFALWQKILPKDVTIPRVAGLPQEEAIAALEHVGLRPQLVKGGSPSEKVPKGSVVAIMPDEGRHVKEGRIVRVVTSSGSIYTKIPAVVATSIDQGRKVLEDGGLTITNEQYVYDDKIPEDQIISISPKVGTKVLCSSAVSLVISKGPEKDELVVQDGEPIMHSSVLTIDIPLTDSDPAEVRIDVTDDEGTQTVYQEEHNPGDSIVYTVQGTGDTTAHVYFGSKLILTRKF